MEWFWRHADLLKTMDKELKRIYLSFIPGTILVAALWLVKFIEIKSGHLLTEYGVLPRTLSGLKGVITSPFIHGDLKHLLSNSIPLLVLCGGLFYFYKSLAYRVFGGIYLLGGFWLWLGGRESYHIGASGLVYGITTFLFFSGVFRRDLRLMALSLLVVFLYGGMIWGIFPLFVGVSWEAHLFGSLAGMLYAFVYRNEGPQRKKYEWENTLEDENEEDESDAYWKIPVQNSVTGVPAAIEEPKQEIQQQINIHYIYKPKNESSSPPSDPNEKN